MAAAPIPEIQVAVKFIVSCMYGKLPRRRADVFAEELSVAIQTKFQGHWYADQPTKGSAYRCLHFTSKEVDPVFQKASEASNIPFSEVSTYIPSELSVWVDPGEVSYQIGEKGTQSVLYRRNMIGQEEFGHDVSQQTQTEIINGSDAQKLYTVAEFMSTKFGSMKNRGQRARALAQQQQQQHQQQQQQHQSSHHQMQQHAMSQHQAQQQLFQQSQQILRQQLHQMNQMKNGQQISQPNFQQQQAFLQQQLLIQKLAMQNLAKLQSQKAMEMANKNRNKPQYNSRWNETTPLQTNQNVQPELQLNMNSQGGFVPQFINNSASSRAESNPSPRSDSSFQSSTWSSPSSPIGTGKMESCWSSSSSAHRWSPGLSSGEDSGHASNDDDLDLDQEIFDQIAALRIEAH